MRKISQRAWNNVLIFSVLALIFIFNWDKFFAADSSEKLTPLTTQDVVLSMRIDLLTFERVGTGWRVQGPQAMIPPDLTSEKIDELVGNWQSLSLSETTNTAVAEALSRPQHVIDIFIAGKDQPMSIYLSVIGQTAYAMINNQAFEVLAPNMRDLIPVRAMEVN